MDAYQGVVKDIDLALWRGSYTIDSLKIDKIDAKVKEPFIEVNKIDLSVQWRSLFKGEIVGEIDCYQPKINFAFGESSEQTQTGEEEDWTKVVKSLIPIKINRFAISEGEIALTNILTEPKTDLPLKDFQLEITNIQNVEEQVTDSLPSSIVASGTASDYGGTLYFNASAYLLKEIPDFDYNLGFEDVNLISLNPLAKYYTGMDFEKGTISIYSEMAMKDQTFEGYIKPLVKEMRIFNWKEDNRPLGQWIKEFFSEGIQEIFENQKKQQFATRVPIQGQLDNINTNIWLTVFNSFKNAYIKAFEYKLDKSIDFKDLQAKTEKKK